nr:hypothetical protein [uncultured Schaedlerella sp.]
MKEEQYHAKCPRHIRIADAAYLDNDGKGKKEYEAIDYQPPSEFQMGILLEQFQAPFEKDCTRYAMGLYFAPEQSLDACMNHEALRCRGLSQRWAETGSASYMVTADERQETVKTEADGIWSQYQEFYSHEGNARKTEAVLILLVVPDDETFDGMRSLVYSLFEEVRPVPLKEKLLGKEKSGKMAGHISVRGALQELRKAETQGTGHPGEQMLPKAAAKKQGNKERKKKDPER